MDPTPELKPSQPVSRVLSWTVIIWDARRRTPQATYPEQRGRASAPLFVLSEWGLRATSVARRAVRSYAPFHPYRLPVRDEVLRRYHFCGTFRGLAPPALPGTLPYGARTFSKAEAPATVQPTRPRVIAWPVRAPFEAAAAASAPASAPGRRDR